MKLYAFESCPFCLRVRTLAGLKQQVVELEYVTLGAMPRHLPKGYNTLPILVVDKNCESTRYIKESSQIAGYIDKLTTPRLLQHYTTSDRFQAWLDTAKPDIDALCYPRLPRLQLPELSTPHAMQRFKSSREGILGLSLDQALQNTGHYIKRLQPKLDCLSNILQIEQSSDKPSSLNYDDIAAFAELRHISLIDELHIPPALEAHLTEISQRSGILLPSHKHNYLG